MAEMKIKVDTSDIVAKLPLLKEVIDAAKAAVYEYKHPASGDGDLWDKMHRLDVSLKELGI